MRVVPWSRAGRFAVRWIIWFWMIWCGACLACHVAKAHDRRVEPIADTLRQEFQLDPFYVKCAIADGLPIVASAKVTDYALLEAAYLIDRVLLGRDDLRRALVEAKIRFGVLATTEFTTQMPEYRYLQPALFWDKRARGLGATPEQPLVSCGEENLLNLEGDPYQGENILIHEFAHALHLVALRKVDPTFDTRLQAAFAESRRLQLWKSTYSATNSEEYWAEGVQSWFNCNRHYGPQHNRVETREKLQAYDPGLARLVHEVFGENSWTYVPCERRQQAEHLAGFDALRAPPFEWPAEVLEWNRLNLGTGEIRGKTSNGEIVISTHARVAGAIQSLTWNGKEFLDKADHGRLLQSASSFDVHGSFLPEVFNPTEAGSRADGASNTAASSLFRYQAAESGLRSITQMAFWLGPGEKTPSGDLAGNETVVSNHWLSRRVQIGYQELTHAIEYEVTFTLPEDEWHTYAQFEALTGYMPAEFGNFWQFHPDQGEFSPLDDGPGEQPLPVAFSTSDGAYAMGIYSPDQPSPGFEQAGYGRFRFAAEQVNKWNCVFRLRDEQGIAADKYIFRCFVIVGTLDDVRQTMGILVHEFATPN